MHSIDVWFVWGLFAARTAYGFRIEGGLLCAAVAGQGEGSREHLTYLSQAQQPGGSGNEFGSRFLGGQVFGLRVVIAFRGVPFQDFGVRESNFMKK